MPSNDVLRAALIAVVNSLVPFLTQLGVLDWSAETTSAFMLVISTTLTLVFLLYRGGTSAPP